MIFFKLIPLLITTIYKKCMIDSPKKTKILDHNDILSQKKLNMR